MQIIGLTGGIASGKSFVLSYVKNLKIPVHDSDGIVKELYKKPSKKFLLYLKTNGFENAIKENKIIKKIIKEEFFFNKSKKEKLEKFIHKEVGFKRKIFLKKNKKKQVVFLDIPLLFEKNLASECDFVCTTISPIKTREKRALKRKHMTKAYFKLILKNQVRDVYRRKNSHYLIKTNQTKKQTRKDVDKIIKDIIGK